MADGPEITDTVKSSALTGQIKSFSSGGVGGICAVLVGMICTLQYKCKLIWQISIGHPFDLIKVR